MAGRNQKCPSEQAKGLDRHLPRDPHRPNKRLKNTPDPSYFSPFAPSFFWFSPRLRLVFRPPLRPSFLESSVLELSDLSYTPRLCRFPLCWSSSLANSLSSVKTPLSHHDHAPNLYATSSVIECGVPVPSPPNNSTAFYNSTCLLPFKKKRQFRYGEDKYRQYGGVRPAPVLGTGIGLETPVLGTGKSPILCTHSPLWQCCCLSGKSSGVL